MAGRKRARLIPEATQEEYSAPIQLAPLGSTITEQGIVTFNGMVHSRLFAKRQKEAAERPDLVEIPIPSTNENCFNIYRGMPLFRAVKRKKNPRTGAYEHHHRTPQLDTKVFAAWNNKRMDEDYLFVGFAASNFIQTPGVSKAHHSPNTLAVNSQGTCTWWGGPKTLNVGDRVYLAPPPLMISRRTGQRMPRFQAQVGMDPSMALPVFMPVDPLEHGQECNMVANLGTMIYEGGLQEKEMYAGLWKLLTLDNEGLGDVEEKKALAKIAGQSVEEYEAHVTSIANEIKTNPTRFGFTAGGGVGAVGMEAARKLKRYGLLCSIESQKQWDFFQNRVVGKVNKAALPGGKVDILIWN